MSDGEEDSRRAEERVWPIDPENKTVDMSYLRPTDQPSNKRVYLPGPINRKIEIQMQKLKLGLLDATRDYVSSEKYQSNLTRREEN